MGLRAGAGRWPRQSWECRSQDHIAKHTPRAHTVSTGAVMKLILKVS